MRTTIATLRNLDASDLDYPIVCPAGQRLEADGVPACRCGIEESVISAATDPSSLAKFCMNAYVACPTWRAEKERIWSGRSQPLVGG
jgi:hypothetical protein